MKMTKQEKLLFRKQHGDKALKQLNKLNRVVNGFNTGTISFKTEKNYSRKQKHKKNYLMAV